MKVVAFTPIKLNSQRIPNKNTRLIGDKPMCSYIVDTLLSVPHIDETYVFCSDESVKNYVSDDAIFLQRDSYLDGNEVKGFEIYKAFIEQVDADIYVLAHTTSPFISVESIKTGLEKVINEDYDSAFSAKKIQTFSWFNGKPLNYDFTDVPRTQDIEPIYVETSGFYIFKKEIFTEHGRRIGFKPYLQSVTDIEAIDIDEPQDFEFASLVSGVINK